MRIIAGKHRGKRLAEFRGEDVRPTPDRVKESLFQILETRLADARVLDLFAGTGALGLEALSRGASEAVFNDASRDSVALLEKNLRLAGEKGKIFCLDYAACLGRVEGKFDLIFCDPPYKQNYAASILEKVASRELLAEGGLVVYESEREELPIDGWTVADSRRYGRTKVFLFARSNP